jgi:hypothetical protein
MPSIERTESICTLSWIDGKTGLPENDAEGPAYRIPGAFLTREDNALKFRFVNLLEARVTVIGSSSARTISGGFTPDSKIYKNPSFAGIASEPFEPKRSVTPLRDRVVFQQTIGARTVSPEVIGQRVGFVLGIGNAVPIPIARKIGRAAAHALQGFPPIWTTLELTMFADGRSEGKVLQHSLFPSMNFYTRPDVFKGQPRLSSVYQLVGKPYDAVPELDRWNVHGWGVLHRDPGPCEGNPWGYNKEDLTIRPVVSATKIV